jgi:hypothetical protein
VNKTDAREVLEAIATRDQGVPAQALERLGDKETLLLISAAVGVASEMNFQPGGDPVVVTQFADMMQQRYADRYGIKPRVVEALVRAALGEDELLADVAGEDVLSTGMLVVYEILSERHLGVVDLSDFYNEVLELAEEFEAAT